MKVEFNGTQIEKIEDWRNLIFSGKKKKHWKEGRSAYSLADFILHKKGEAFIQDEVAKVLNEDLSLDIAYPEYEVRFDKLGHGREHDLGVYGKTASGKSIFIGVEAKVDETFGSTIADAYIAGKIKELNGVRTNIPMRIEELLKRDFQKVKKSLFDLRYQLLYSTVGTTSVPADIRVLLVLVFETSVSDAVIIESNKKDYLEFFNQLDGERLPKTDDFQVDINGEKLSVIYRMVEL